MRRASPPVRLERESPLPYFEPVGTNDNEDELPPAPRVRRRRLGLLQLLARLLIAPFYLAVATAAVGLIALFVWVSLVG